MSMLRLVTLAFAAVALASCGDSNAPKDYLKIAGGGLTFNYRYSQATAVVVGKQLFPLPEGSTVEALFEIPNEKEPERVSRPTMTGKLSYKLESKPLIGIKKGVPLKVVLRVIDKDGKEIDREETAYTSDVDQDTLPSKPLVKPDSPNYVPQLENLN